MLRRSWRATDTLVRGGRCILPHISGRLYVQIRPIKSCCDPRTSELALFMAPDRNASSQVLLCSDSS